MKRAKKLEETALSTPITLVGCIVTKGGVPCTLVNVTGGHKGGLLLPGTPAVAFLKVRDARRAIARTERVAETLRGSLVGTWDRVQALFSPGAFAVVGLGRQLVQPKALEVAKS